MISSTHSSTNRKVGHIIHFATYSTFINSEVKKVSKWCTISFIHILKNFVFIHIECFRKVPYRPKYCTMHSSVLNSLSRMQWTLKFFRSSSSYSDIRFTFVSFGRLLESATWINGRFFWTCSLLYYHSQYWSAYLLVAANNLFYLEACGNRLGSIYQ